MRTTGDPRIPGTRKVAYEQAMRTQSTLPDVLVP